MHDTSSATDESHGLTDTVDDSSVDPKADTEASLWPSRRTIALALLLRLLLWSFVCVGWTAWSPFVFLLPIMGVYWPWSSSASPVEWIERRWGLVLPVVPPAPEHIVQSFLWTSMASYVLAHWLDDTD